MNRKHHHATSESDSHSSSPSPSSSTHHRRTPTKQKDYTNSEYEDDQWEEEAIEEGEEEEEEFPSAKNPSPSPPYVKIAPLPIFRGTVSESATSHLSRFKKVCRANNASSAAMQKRIFPVTLEGEAALWYDLNVEPYHASLTWQETTLSFLQAYHTVEPVEELRSELAGLRQAHRERVRSYFLRLQWILKRWPQHGFSDDLLRGVFVDGLREEFRRWVLMQKPSSLSDALRLAFEFEKVRSVRGNTNEEFEGFDISGGYGRDEGEAVKKRQCQCSKHECGKKKNLLRNSSSLQSRVSQCD